MTFDKPIGRWALNIKIEFVRRHLCIGCLWSRGWNGLLTREHLEIWLYLVPFLPIYVCFERGLSEEETAKVKRKLSGDSLCYPKHLVG